MSRRKFIPATGWSWFLRFYDPLVGFWTRESTVKRQLCDHAELPRGAVILDAGCGSGTLALELLRRDRQLQVIAADVDRRILAQFREKCDKLPAERDASRRIGWCQAYADRLPLANASVDAVVCTLLMHHLLPGEKEQTCREFFRVVKPAGKLILADFGRPATPAARLLFGLVRLIDGYARTECNLTGRLPGLVQQAGFARLHELAPVATPLGTIRSWMAIKPSVSPPTP